MIGRTGAIRVTVATKPRDFRKGAEGLAALVRETMGADPFSGAAYVFRARRAERRRIARRQCRPDVVRMLDGVLILSSDGGLHLALFDLPPSSLAFAR